jgi:hypothetical protein
MKFYDTINLSPGEFRKACKDADKQVDKILLVFKSTSIKYLTPAEVYNILEQKYPITSIRRAMTNMTGTYLTKTDYQKKGLYGKANYCWTLNTGLCGSG